MGGTLLNLNVSVNEYVYQMVALEEDILVLPQESLVLESIASPPIRSFVKQTKQITTLLLFIQQTHRTLLFKRHTKFSALAEKGTIR